MSSHFEGADLKTAAKLKVLEKYLNGYTTIMDKHWDKNWYVDTHAGSGKTMTDRGVLIDGGAIRAIRNHSDSFDAFYLYEVDPDHFELLCDTIEDEFGFDMTIEETAMPGRSFRRARHDPEDGPKILAMELDSNEGATQLAEWADERPHWFVFVDPAGLTVHRETLDTLISRGHADILVTYQTDGVLRNATEKSGHGAVERQHGDQSWKECDSRQEYVDAFCSALESHEDLETESKDMTPPKPYEDRYRFDLVFAAKHPVARNIITDIWDNDDRWDEASDELGDVGLSHYT